MAQVLADIPCMSPAKGSEMTGDYGYIGQVLVWVSLSYLLG